MHARRRYLDKLIEVDDRPAEEQTNLKREFLHFLQVRSARQEYRNAWVRACVRGWYPVRVGGTAWVPLESTFYRLSLPPFRPCAGMRVRARAPFCASRPRAVRLFDPLRASARSPRSRSRPGAAVGWRTRG